MTAAISVTPSGNPSIDGMLYGTRWAATNLTFSFPTAASDLSDYSTPLNSSDFTVLTSTERLAVEAALASWSSVSGLTFTEASSVSSSDLRIYWYNSGDNITARVLDFPGDRPEAGDIQFGAALGPTWDQGTYTALTVMHEIGHALGLKHPHMAANRFPALGVTEDSIELSVMSYRSYLGGALTGYSVTDGHFPLAPMLNDIAAIQHLYGANWATNAGDTIYTLDPGAPVVFRAVWDGGGVDTYNLANYSTPLIIDLRPGAWSDFGMQHAVLDSSSSKRAIGNLVNPYLYQGDLRSLIEDVWGGSGNDRITGN
ncbi:M10 family metallopeptidase [Microvirga roseola]|uniref:M10 family metallopeptidase n=1 Tax=Microvirga roseola TaxID=2883126 RepID=UPI001E5E9A18|nr:M10 family metallopeptidase [Microvirga roseola]